MKKHLQNALFGLTISLILTTLVSVNADTSKTMDSQIRYQWFHYGYDDKGRIYHRFLPSPRPTGLYYSTKLKATANIDDTPEKETVVLMTVGINSAAFPGNWDQAFLLITDPLADGFTKKIDLFSQRRV